MYFWLLGYFERVHEILYFLLCLLYIVNIKKVEENGYFYVPIFLYWSARNPSNYCANNQQIVNMFVLGHIHI